MEELHTGHAYSNQAVASYGEHDGDQHGHGEHDHSEHVDKKHKQDILNRLKSVEGHVRGIERMVEEDIYCVDIIKQTLAVQRAIDKLNALILESHLQTCVTTAIRSEDGRERERVIGEIVEVFEATNKL
jgi:CsoR family transcriptional regulator, copper-sensing transcriptional repressor